MTTPMNDAINSQIPRPHEFLWYSLVSETIPITQGDFLNHFPIIVPSIETLQNIPVGEGTITLKGLLDEANVVVMTQSFARQFMRVGLPIDLPENFPVLPKSN